MKTMNTKLITFCLLSILTGLYNVTRSQCTVNIIPQGPLSFCNGDSVLLVASAGGSTQLPDQSDYNYNAGMSARTLPGYSFWQSFTAGMSGTLSQVDLGFFNFINGTAQLSIYQGTGTTGLLLYNQIVNVYCASGNCLLPFPVNAHVIAGARYSINFIPLAGIPDPYGVQVELPGTLSGGVFAVVDPSGTDTSNSFDMVFDTYIARELYFHWSNGDNDSVTVASSTGTYVVTATDSVACSVSDSIDVIVTMVDTAVSVAGATLTAHATGATYQWINCNGNSPISGANAQNYTAVNTGNYAVVLNQNGCADTSACYHIITVALSEPAPFADLKIYPNPSTGKFYIGDDNSQNSNFEIEIYNVLGEKVYRETQVWGKIEFDFSDYPGNIYLAKIKIANEACYRRIIIR